MRRFCTSSPFIDLRCARSSLPDSISSAIPIRYSALRCDSQGESGHLAFLLDNGCRTASQFTHTGPDRTAAARGSGQGLCAKVQNLPEATGRLVDQSGLGPGNIGVDRRKLIKCAPGARVFFLTDIVSTSSCFVKLCQPHSAQLKGSHVLNRFCCSIMSQCVE